MAAFHHLNGQLFMPAKWIKDLPVHPDEITMADEASTETVRDRKAGIVRRVTPEEALWSRKTDEAIKSGVYNSVMREGVVNPVKLEVQGRTPMIKNGFHRVASVDDMSFVPITYEDAPEVRPDLPAHEHRENEERRRNGR